MKVNIQGGGPAGLSSAIVLSKYGFDVKLFEQQKQIGGLLKYDIQAIRNYGKYDNDILTKFQSNNITLKNFNKIYRIEKYSPELKCDTIFSTTKPLFLSVERGISEESLEIQLYNNALDNGCEINLGTNLAFKEADIVACGSKFKPTATIYGVFFESKDIETDTIKFFFLHEKGHNGYAYIIPYKDGKATFAVASFKNENFNKLKISLENIIKHNKIVNKIISEKKILHKYGGHGHFNIPKSAIYKNKLLIGGAAGFVEAARGFGLKYAILSGALAAKSLILDENYDLLWKEEFEQELIQSFQRKLMFEKLTKENFNKLVKGGKQIPVNQYEKIGKVEINDPITNLITKFNLIKWRKQFTMQKLGET